MSTKKEIIDEIVRIELEMFQGVNEGGDRSPCQEDPKTFSAMRRAQYNAWPEDVCRLLLEDFQKAYEEGRNLVAEKYIHMMRTTDPEQYDLAIESIPQPSEEQKRLAREINDQLIKETEAVFQEYPYLAKASRPLRASEDTPVATSIETYQLGELYTYSEAVLRALGDYVAQSARAGKSVARQMLENTVRHYGYLNLIEANFGIKEKLELAEKPLIFESDCDSCELDSCDGCSRCSGC